jgi:hypothetical protein
MAKKKSCCGAFMNFQAIGETVALNSIKKNPDVKNATTIIYVGSEKKKLKGDMSGLTYYVSPQQRYVKVDKSDVELILRGSDFIKKK